MPIKPATKPGYKTTEFYATFIASGTAWLSHAAQSGQLPLKWAVAIQSGLAVGYSISRGLAKLAVAFQNPKN